MAITCLKIKLFFIDGDGNNRAEHGRGLDVARRSTESGTAANGQNNTFLFIIVNNLVVWEYSHKI
jgi:hypothetical protein